jgi:DNA replication and repair protein RecF
VILRALRATNFRGYAELGVELAGRLTVLAGDNAQGKTNFLRAVETLGLGDASALADGEAVRFGAERAAVEGRIEKDGGSYDERLRVDLSNVSSVKLSLNGKAVPRSRWIGRLPVLFVGPEDRDQVTGPPSARRALLDELLEQCEPEYLAALREYRRALRQRNRALSRPESTEGEIEIWEEPLARAGSVLLAHRLRAVSVLGPRATEWHRELVGGNAAAGNADSDGLSIEYVSEIPAAAAGEAISALAQSLAEALASGRARERLFGSTLVGPHRDEVSISFAGRPLKGAGSSGEIWSAILALALASAEHLGRRLGTLPVLLLDDVLTALDETRRDRLLGVLLGMPQAMLTTTHRPRVLAGRAVDVFAVSGHSLERVDGMAASDAGLGDGARQKPKSSATSSSATLAKAQEGRAEWEPDQGLLARC